MEFFENSDNPVLKELSFAIDRKLSSIKSKESQYLLTKSDELLPFLLENDSSSNLNKYLIQLLQYVDIENEKKQESNQGQTSPNSQDSSLQLNDKLDSELDQIIPNYLKFGSLGNELILQQIYHHTQDLDRINRQLNKTIMDNYPQFMTAMGKIQDIGSEITKNSVLCRNARLKLKHLKENEINTALHVLDKSKTHKKNLTLFTQLKRINHFLEDCDKINLYLDKKNYPETIVTLIKCGNTLHGDPIFQKINSLKSLSNTLQKKWEIIIDKMFISLKNCCDRFNEDLFQNVVIGSRLLESNELQMKIASYYSEHVSQNLKKIARSYAFKRDQFQVENLSKLNFNELCKYIHSDDVLSCCLQVFSVLSDLLYNYNSMHLWYKKIEAQKELKKVNKLDSNSSYNRNIEDAINDPKIPSIYEIEITSDIKFLEENKTKLWDIIQNMLSSFLASVRFSEFKPDKFLQVNHGVSLICILGQKFSGDKSTQLWKTLSDQTKKYLLHYHRAEVLENLRNHISFEHCERLDLNIQLSGMKVSKRDWSSVHEHIKLVKEFLPVIENNTTSIANLEIISNENVRNIFREASNAGQFDIFSLEKSDFVSNLDNYKEESDESDEEADAYDKEEISDFFLQGQKLDATKPSRPKKKNTGIYTILNSTHVVLKQIPFFLHAMQVFETQRLDLFYCLTSIFYLYLYSIHLTFTNFNSKEYILPENDNNNLSIDLIEVFTNIRKLLDRYNLDNNLPFPVPIVEQADTILYTQLFGIVARTNAAETLIFLRDLAEQLGPQLKNLIPKNYIEKVDEFVQTFSFASNAVRKIIYDKLVSNTLNMESYSAKISSSKFVVTMLRESNPYVQVFLLDMKKYFESISKFENDMPSISVKEIWNSATRQLTDCIVDGFSKVKKCNNEGRALMQLDFNALQGGLTEISNYEIIGAQKVKNYIQGYYLQESDILEWVKTVKNDYSYKQIESLINLGCGLNMKKKAKLELLKNVENIVGKEKNQSSWITQLGFRK